MIVIFNSRLYIRIVCLNVVEVLLFREFPMLIRKLRKNLCSQTIAQLDYLFSYPAISHNNSTYSHSPGIQFFSTSQQALANPKPLKAKSAAQSSIADNAPRLAKSDAQAALFDYLHSTRGLSFLDAEHISKNSPRFLEDLMAMVEAEKDVTKALPRWFRYHPINEFEPFFESLGLSPQEFGPLLPRGLMFLSDNQLLLDNYHTLFVYGVPRSEVGRIYKEAREIFAFGFGELDMKLRAYERLGLSRSTVIKLVTCSPRLFLGEVNDASIKVIEKLRKMGFDSNWIGGYLSSKKTYNWKRILDTLCFLGEVGYSDEQMGALFRKDTALLFAGSGKLMYAVVGSLVKLGLNMNEIFASVSNNPEILSPKCVKNYWKALHLLFNLEMAPENIAQLLSNHMNILISQSVKGLKTVLRNYNGDKCSLREAIEKDPSVFSKLAFHPDKHNHELESARSPSNIMEKTDFLLRIGYLENTDEMVKAQKQFRGRGDLLQERFECLLKAGLEFNVASGMVKQAPAILNQSKDILEKKMDYLRNYLGYPVESIVGFPSYLGYDVERIRVRFCMYGWLRERGAAKAMLSLSTLLACSDARFVKYFVNVHPQGPEMWENLKRSLPEMSS